MAVQSAWEQTDLPILRILVDYFDHSDTPIPVEEIALLAELPVIEVKKSLLNLGKAEPPYIEYMHDGSSNYYPMLITGLAKRAWLTVYEIDESIADSAVKVTFNRLDETEFEEFCFDLLVASDFVNVDWRKGTGLHSSPSDGGRDIVAQLRQVDIDDSERLETWFVDCKHYERCVSPRELQNLLSWSQAERPDVALFIASGWLSNPAKDYLETWKQQNNPPFRIKHWERPYLVRMIRRKADLLAKYPIQGREAIRRFLRQRRSFLTRFGISDL
jgi:hypothetical protein